MHLALIQALNAYQPLSKTIMECLYSLHYIQNKIALVNFKKKMAVDREKRSSLLSI